MEGNTVIDETGHAGPPPQSYPKPPKVTGYESSGGELGSPSTITLTANYYAPGFVDDYDTDVKFSVRDGTAELRRIDDQDNLPQALLAAEAASREVANHPAVDEVLGVDALIEKQRAWIRDCEQFEETGWVKMAKKPESTIATCVEAYEHEDGEQYILWTTPEDLDQHPDILVEHHHEDGDTVDQHDFGTIEEAREMVVENTTGTNEE